MNNNLIIFRYPILMVLLLGYNTVSYGQTICTNINTLSIDITWNKTTSIIFPAKISNVDRGSTDILAQKIKGVDNILQLKAGKTDFPETNLTVITGDGAIFHFIVNYTSRPEELILEIGKSGEMDILPALFDSIMTGSEFEEYSGNILSADNKGKLIGKRKFKLTFDLKALYISDNVLFVHLHIKNRSNVNYDIDFLKFYIRDKKQFKRTASQQHEVDSLYVLGDIGLAIKGHSETDFIYALEKFTIPDARHFVIELYEKKGGRHMHISVKNRMIVSARPIS